MVNGKKEIMMKNEACAEKADTLSSLIFADNNPIKRKVDFII